MKKVTIQDIADELGISRNTVSKAINNADGLAEAIGRVGEKLKTYFPYRSDDVNELPDEISFHENDGED